MKQKFILMHAFCLATCMLTLGSGVSAQITIPEKLQKNIQRNELPKEVTIPANLLKKDIDLSAHEIRVSLLRVYDANNAKIKIEGIVKNVGRLAYTSGTGQQVALLYEEMPGSGMRLVATRNFRNLGVNATTSLAFTKIWNKTANAEFPPNYVLVITFDPDLYTDGNTNNDDAVSTNNRITKAGSEINAIPFR